MDGTTHCHVEWASNCEIAKGGFFDVGKSKTWTLANQSLLDMYPQVNGLLNGRTGVDVVHLGDDFAANDTFLSLSGYDWGNIPYSTFGMGPNSTILHDLYATGSIPSKTWSYFHGQEGAIPAEGSLILGGYDAAALPPGSPNFTQPFSGAEIGRNRDCDSQTVVSISEIKLVFKNGTTASLLEGSSGIDACILITYPWIAEMPHDVLNDFVRKTATKIVGNSTSPFSSGQILVDSENAFDGDLRFNFNNGALVVDIPNQELITQETIISNGQIVANNSGSRLLRLTEQTQNEEGFKQGQRAMRLGAPFFSAAYLMMDTEKSRFTVGKPLITTKKDVVPFPGTSATCNGNASAPTDHHHRHHLSAGAIAGAVVGSIAGAVLLLARAYVKWRRKGERGGLGGWVGVCGTAALYLP